MFILYFTYPSLLLLMDLILMDSTLSLGVFVPTIYVFGTIIYAVTDYTYKHLNQPSVFMCAFYLQDANV